jgi:hypothetical protein
MIVLGITIDWLIGVVVGSLLFPPASPTPARRKKSLERSFRAIASTKP